MDSSTPQTADGGPPLSHAQILEVLFGVMTGMLLAALDQSIVGTALPRIVSDLGGLDRLSWVVTAYLLTSTAATPLWGKISDLYGRRRIFQVAISIFLLGSILSGASQNMLQLILFRGLQGIGGGGLFSIAFAIIGDVIPPRERGRYQGYFGAVFGLSSVAGPLLGGWLTDGPGWRWIFYINVPIGIASLAITTIALKLPRQRRPHSIDYAGAVLIVGSVSALLLYLNWAGGHYGWQSSQGLGLVGVALVLAILFVLAELRAAEPIIPMRLFQNSIFSVGNAFAFCSGVALFGGAIFLPVYLQAVQGMSPTKSGLAMIPMVAGIFGTSILSGNLITRTGGYKIFPVLGSAILGVGLFMFSRTAVDTPYWQIAIDAFIAGAGLGFTMQTILVAIQNAVAMRDLGTATSSVTFFRQTGAAIGTAVFGAVLSSRLTYYLQQEMRGRPLPPGRGPNVNNVQAIHHLPEPIKGLVLTAFTHAIDDVFMTGIPFVAVALLVALFLREIPLRSSETWGSAGEEAAAGEGLLAGG